MFFPLCRCGQDQLLLQAIGETLTLGVLWATYTNKLQLTIGSVELAWERPICLFLLLLELESVTNTPVWHKVLHPCHQNSLGWDGMGFFPPRYKSKRFSPVQRQASCGSTAHEDGAEHHRGLWGFYCSKLWGAHHKWCIMAWDHSSLKYPGQLLFLSC